MAQTLNDIPKDAYYNRKPIMKYIIFTPLLSLAFAAFAGDSPPASEDNAITELKYEISAELSIIRTRSDLDNYITTHPRSEINSLPLLKKELLIESMVFTPFGLASFAPESLEGQSVSAAFSILKLFGLEHHIGSIPGLQISNEIDEAIIVAFPAPDHLPLAPNEVCSYMIFGDPKWRCTTGGSWCDRFRCNSQTP